MGEGIYDIMGNVSICIYIEYINFLYTIRPINDGYFILISIIPWIVKLIKKCLIVKDWVRAKHLFDLYVPVVKHF